MNIERFVGYVTVLGAFAAASLFIGDFRARVKSLEGDRFFHERRDAFRVRLIEDAGNNPGNGVPIATILPYYGIEAPVGFLLCDGAIIDRTAEADRFEALYIYLTKSNPSLKVTGSENLARLPDLRGLFLRGLDSKNKRDTDSSRTLGSVQEDEFREHSHAGAMRRGEVNGRLVGASLPPEQMLTSDRGHSDSALGDSIPNSTDVRGGLETRPVNMALNFIIKF